MKKLLIILMFLSFFACEKNEIINNCDCKDVTALNFNDEATGTAPYKCEYGAEINLIFSTEFKQLITENHQNNDIYVLITYYDTFNFILEKDFLNFDNKSFLVIFDKYNKNNIMIDLFIRNLKTGETIFAKSKIKLIKNETYTIEL